MLLVDDASVRAYTSNMVRNLLIGDPCQSQVMKAGWGVLRLEPWHLAGIFVSSIDAENLAKLLGSTYAVTYGEHVHGSPDFTVTSDQKL